LAIERCVRMRTVRSVVRSVTSRTLITATLSGSVAAVRFPDFELEAVDGGTVSLDDLLGKPFIAYLARHPG
jgi:cytochrome oxidase Cu insertion factor (SCO1/SenC/PrrC family)